eukprot:TRINITY_DN26863_c0_g1_i1.p1 TRINITY_DN26863_c0_g1~~TRINITY_DN26863_c0_g1_i1.p1  ORF type:complete len:370 (-),score=58.04 TRINITY_DN26863_c0_g1_i1:51-1160(-)
MGAVLSWFRKAPIESQLQQIDAEIHVIEERRLELYASKRRRVSSLLFYSVFLWLCYCGYFYWFHFQAHFEDLLSKAVFASPIILLPLIVYFLQWLVTSYYSRKIATDETNLLALKAKQKSKLEELAAKTDFYKTQALLDRYSKTVNTPLADPDARPKAAPKTPPSALRQRVVSSGSGQRPTPARPAAVPIAAGAPSTRAQDGPPAPPAPATPVVSEPVVATQRVPVTPMPVPVDVVRMARHTAVQRPAARPTTPVDPNRPWWDKVVDYIVGDSPGDSVATICRNCNVPNGIVPRDEIAFIAFRCRSCGHFNEKERERLPDGTVRELFAPREPSSAPASDEPTAAASEDAPAVGEHIQEVPGEHIQEVPS